MITRYEVRQTVPVYKTRVVAAGESLAEALQAFKDTPGWTTGIVGLKRRTLDPHNGAVTEEDLTDEAVAAAKG